jgi:hypothetical protein
LGLSGADGFFTDESQISEASYEAQVNAGWRTAKLCVSLVEITEFRFGF